ncbi:MAG: hypothetical protein ACLUHE_08940 [Christensenellales bacterium]
MGAIAAAALSESDEIGYIADYPIYGTPTSINAFALGADASQPARQIVLEWSTLPGHSPEAALAARGVHIISSRDISAPSPESRAFGLYHEQDGVIANLAMPIWNWGKLLRGHRPQHPDRRWSDEGDAQRRPRHELPHWACPPTRLIIICLPTPARAHAAAGRSAARAHPRRRVPAVRRADCRSGRSGSRRGRRGADPAGDHPDGLPAGNVIGRIPRWTS